MTARVFPALRIVLPAIWLGLIIAIDLIEAPLKFQAPGITIPLGLGIGRLVFAGMNVAEVLIAALLATSLWRTRADARSWRLAAGIFTVLIGKVAVIRPLLAGYTNAVLAGGEGGSPLHVVYIAVDALLFALLVWLVARQSRLLLLTPPAAEVSYAHPEPATASGHS